MNVDKRTRPKEPAPPPIEQLLLVSGSQGSRADSSLDASEDSMFRMSDSLLGVFSDLEPSLVEPPCSRKEKVEKQLRTMAKTNPKAYDSIMKNQQKVLDSKFDGIITEQGSNPNVPEEREVAEEARKQVYATEGGRDHYESFRDLLNGSKEGNGPKVEPKLYVEPEESREPEKEKITVVDYPSTGQVEAFTPLMKKPPLPPKSPRAKAEAAPSAQGSPLQKNLSQVSAASAKSAKSNSSRASKKAQKLIKTKSVSGTTSVKSFLGRVSNKSQKPEPKPQVKSESIKPSDSAVSKKSHKEEQPDPLKVLEPKPQAEPERDPKLERSPQPLNLSTSTESKTSIKSSASSRNAASVKATDSVKSAGSTASSKEAARPASPVERSRSTSSQSIDYSERTPSVYLPPIFQRLQQESKEGTLKSEASPAANKVPDRAPKSEETGKKNATQRVKSERNNTRKKMPEGTPKSELDALSGMASSFFSGTTDVQTGAAVVKPVTKPEPNEMIPTSADKVKSILEALSDSAWAKDKDSPKQASAEVVQKSSSEILTAGSIEKAGSKLSTASIADDESAILRRKDGESSNKDGIDDVQLAASAASAPADFPSVQKSSSADASTTPVLAGVASPFDEVALDKDSGKAMNTVADTMKQKEELVSGPSKWKSKFNVKGVFHRGAKSDKLDEISKPDADDLDEEIQLLEDELEATDGNAKEHPASAKEKKSRTKRHKSPLRGIFHRQKPSTTEDKMAVGDELSPVGFSRSPSPDRVSVAMSEVSVPLTSIEKKAEHFFGNTARPADESALTGMDETVAGLSKKPHSPIIKLDYKNSKEIEIVSKSVDYTPMASQHSIGIENTSTPKNPDKVVKRNKISRMMKKFIHNRRTPTKKEELTPVLEDACVEDKLSLLSEKEKKDETAAVHNKEAIDDEEEVPENEVSRDEETLETTLEEETLVTDIVANKAKTENSRSWFSKVGDMIISTGCGQIRCGETDCLTEEAQKTIEEKWDPIATDFKTVSKQVTSMLTPRSKACTEEAEMAVEEEGVKDDEDIQAPVTESVDQSCGSMTVEDELSNEMDMVEPSQADEPQAEEEVHPQPQTEITDSKVASLEKIPSAEPQKKGALKATGRFKKTLRGRFAKKKALLTTEDDESEPEPTPSSNAGATPTTAESPSEIEDQMETGNRDPTTGTAAAPAIDASPKNDEEVVKSDAPENEPSDAPSQDQPASNDNAQDEGNQSSETSSETESKSPVSFQSGKTKRTKNKFFHGKVAKWKVAMLLKAQKKHNAAIIAKAAANSTATEVAETSSNAEYLTVLAVSDESLDEEQQSSGSASLGLSSRDVATTGPQLTPIEELTDTGGQSKSVGAASSQEQSLGRCTSSDTAEQVLTTPTGRTEATGHATTMSSYDSPRRQTGHATTMSSYDSPRRQTEHATTMSSYDSPRRQQKQKATTSVTKHRSEQTETDDSRQIDSVSFDNATFDDDLSNAFAPRLPGYIGDGKWLW